MTVHHLVLDGWSTSILFRELLENLQADRRGEPIETSPAPPFREYVDWIGAQDRARARDFWSDYLGGVEPMRLPESAEAARAESKTYDVLEHELPEELVERIDQLAEKAGVTASIVCQAAWAVLLGRYANAGEVTYGLVLSGRSADLREMEKRVGMYINTVPIRVDWRVEESVVEWLQTLHQRQLEVRQHGYCSPAEIRNWADLPADQALMEATFTFQNYPVDEAIDRVGEAGNGGDLGIVDAEAAERPHNPLAFEMDRAGLTVFFESSRFDQEMIAGLVGHYETLLESMVAESDRPPAAHQMMREADRTRLVDKWARGPEIEAPDAPVHRLFEKRADEHPERVALTFGGGEWSYRELNRRANALANRLRDHGVGPEVPVGVSVARSPELVAALLGVMKAGGAYVALEPGLPQQRLSLMISDADLGIAVTDEAGAENVEEVPTVVEIGEGVSADETPVEPAVSVDGDNPAYVLYTSGTTGRPKGVVTRHAGLANVVYADGQCVYGLAPGEPGAEDRTVLMKASYTFDLFVSELFPPLVVGAQVAVASPGVGTDPEALADAIETHHVTDLWATPSTLKMLVESGEFDRADSLEQIYSAGEALTEGLWEKLEDRSGATLWNLYGPTEMCCGQTGGIVEASSVSEGGISIGEPKPNNWVSMLDDAANPQPEQTDGEIVIAGVGEARGYRGMPRKTAETFVPSMDGEQSGARMYCTGDLGRWRVDGTIDYRGRKDDQLQVRGVRVELEAIEAHLERAPGVAQAVVRPVDEREGRAEALHACIVATEEGPAPEADQLRDYLFERLQPEVVPGQYTFLEEMPTMPSGKVDREALPAPDAQGRDEQIRPPETYLEQQLANLVGSVLEVEEVGVTDNFYTLGGTSLDIPVFTRKFETAFGLELPIAFVVQRPSVSELVDGLLAMEPETEREAKIVRALERMHETPVDADADASGSAKT